MDLGDMNLHGTTIICIKKNNEVAMAGDGQVSSNQTVLKGNAVKVRKIFDQKVMVGFAGATADAFTLMELFEGKLKKYGGVLMRSAVELAKDWRTDRMLRRLEAMMIVSDGKALLLLTGNGDVVESEDGVFAIGSGGNYALSAARALMKHTKMSATEIARESLSIASEICVYTNRNIVLEKI